MFSTFKNFIETKNFGPIRRPFINPLSADRQKSGYKGRIFTDDFSESGLRLKGYLKRRNFGGSTNPPNST